MELRAQILPVSELCAHRMGSMLELMQRHYENVTRDGLLRDLEKKTMVIVLEDKGELMGFSTQEVFQHVVDGREQTIIYSGDTIIAPSHWGTWALPIAWVRMVLDVEREAKSRDLYWLLTTKGYKTYRFLPVFYKTYHPSLDGEATEWEAQLVASLMALKFPRRHFDASRWVLSVTEDGQCLRPGVAEIEERNRKDPHVRFFEERNPGHARGDELVCLARCGSENLKPFIVKRALKK